MPSTPQPAATLILLRDGPVSPEVLMLERHTSSEVLPDLYVFPGGQIEMGHARALLAINGTADQLDAGRQVIKKQLSVRDTERLVRQLLSDKAGKKAKKAQASGNADIRRLEIEITDKIGAKVRIDHSPKGSGKLVIQYNSLDELDGILKHIK